MDLRLADKVFVVTGGSSGIGAAISLALAREGAIPAILARDPDQGDLRVQLEKMSAKAHYVKVDLSSDADCATAVEEIATRFGGIDGLVNCPASAPVAQNWV